MSSKSVFLLFTVISIGIMTCLYWILYVHFPRANYGIGEVLDRMWWGGKIAIIIIPAVAVLFSIKPQTAVRYIKALPNKLAIVSIEVVIFFAGLSWEAGNLLSSYFTISNLLFETTYPAISVILLLCLSLTVSLSINFLPSRKSVSSSAGS